MRCIVPADDGPWFYVECGPVGCLKASERAMAAEDAITAAVDAGFVCVFGAWVCGRCHAEKQQEVPR